VREVIGRRLRTLSPECRATLGIAAVLGREFELGALAHVSGRPQNELLETLEEAWSAKVVSELPAAPGLLRFGHALIRDTLYGELPAPRRLRLHREAGEALEGYYAADRDPHLAELAHHFVASGAAGDPAKATEYARAAGDRAVRLFAYEEAVRLYRVALDAARPGADTTRCELLVALSEAQARAGDEPGAKATALRAAEDARRAGLPELLARAAVGYGGRFLWARSSTDPHLVPLLRDALDAIGEEDSALRVQLLARLATAMRDDPSRKPREALWKTAIDIARRLGDPMTLAYALDAEEAALHGPGTAWTRLTQADEIIALARQIGDHERLFDGHEHAFWAAWEVGDPERRAAAFAGLTQVADELRQPAQLWLAATASASLGLTSGRFDEAPELIERAAEIGRAAIPWNATSTRTLQLFLLSRFQGRLGELGEDVPDDERTYPSPLVHLAVRATILARTGDRAGAAAILADVTRHDLADWHMDEEWLFAVCLLAETCEVVGADEHAPALRAALAPHADLNAAPTEGGLDSVARSLGLLATLCGDFDDAEAHFETALRMNAQMGALPWLAHAEHGFAAMLAMRDAPGDAERARDLARRALDGFRRLGMESHALEVKELVYRM
jgi:tetratricopeptide (TPR) repeat protein